MTRSHPHLSRVLAPCVHITGHNHGTDVIVTSDKRDGAKVSIPIDCSGNIEIFVDTMAWLQNIKVCWSRGASAAYPSLSLQSDGNWIINQLSSPHSPVLGEISIRYPASELIRVSVYSSVNIQDLS